MKAYMVEAMTYTRICTWSGEIIGFVRPPKIERRPLALRGGALVPGDRVTKIRGPRTSAGFFPLHMESGALEYLGTYTDLEGTVVLFDLIREGRRVDLRHGEFGAAHYGYHLATDGDLIFCTHALAGRVIQTDTIEKEGAEAV